MSDENLIPEVTAEVPEQTSEQVQTPQPSKYEETARAQGWVPKEEWQGDPDDWTDAREFVKRGELFHKISNQSGEIKELRKVVTNLIDHHQKVKETEFKRALDYLKSEKKRALEEGNADQVIAVDDAMDQLKAEQQQAAAAKQEAPKGPSPVFTSWVSQNSWYLQDQELRAFADDVGVGHFNRNKGVAEEDLYKYVKERVMKAFPEKFKGQGSKTPSVEGASTSSPRKTDTFKLSDEEERVMKSFVRSGVMTREEYIADLKKVKGVA